jgi:hypothetical protein
MIVTGVLFVRSITDYYEYSTVIVVVQVGYVMATAALRCNATSTTNNAFDLVLQSAVLHSL